jgi:preprotein translocase subunit SecA
MNVISVPSNLPSRREDFPDKVYQNEYTKWRFISTECAKAYHLGRPVLVGTSTIANSELLASLLTNLNIPYKLLNARPENIRNESEIIALAGGWSAVTIATNLVGRGTDIKLGGNAKISASFFLEYIYFTIKLLVDKKYCIFPLKKLFLVNQGLQSLSKVKNDFEWLLQDLTVTKTTLSTLFYKIITNKTLKFNHLYSFYLILFKSYKERVLLDKKYIRKLGGLYVIGTERFESRRIDYQLRGRCARQGDPGSSLFFLSLEDKVLRLFGGQKNW